MGLYDEELSKFRNKEEDEWQRFFLKKEKDEQAPVRALFGKTGYDSLLTNPKYLNAAASRKQEAVFKVIPGQNVGRSRITTLARYVTRRLEYQKDMDNLQLHDANGNEMTDEQTEKILNEWVKDFDAPRDLANQQWKLDKLASMDDKRFKLQHKKDAGEITDREMQDLEELNKQIKGKYYEAPYKFRKVYGNPETSAEDLQAVFRRKSKKIIPVENSDYVGMKNLEYGFRKAGTRKIRLNVKTKDDFKHLLFSPGGKHNDQSLHIAFQDFLARTFEAKGFDTMYVLHQDTQHDHFHVILKAKDVIYPKVNWEVASKEKSKKTHFQPDIADLHAIREEFAHTMTRHGIARVATRRRDRPHTVQLIRDGVEKLKERHTWYQNKLAPVEGQGSGFNAINARASMLRNIDYLQRQEGLKANLLATMGGQGQGLQDDREAMEDIKQELLKPLKPHEIEATIKDFEKRNTMLASKLKSIGEEKPEKRKDRKELERRRATFEKMQKNMRTDVEKAIDELKKSRNPENRGEIDTSIETLNQLLQPQRKMAMTPSQNFNSRGERQVDDRAITEEEISEKIENVEKHEILINQADELNRLSDKHNEAHKKLSETAQKLDSMKSQMEKAFGAIYKKPDEAKQKLEQASKNREGKFAYWRFEKSVERMLSKPQIYGKLNKKTAKNVISIIKAQGLDEDIKETTEERFAAQRELNSFDFPIKQQEEIFQEKAQEFGLYREWSEYIQQKHNRGRVETALVRNYHKAQGELNKAIENAPKASVDKAIKASSEKLGKEVSLENLVKTHPKVEEMERIVADIKNRQTKTAEKTIKKTPKIKR